jgi:hypothetical protein
MDGAMDGARADEQEDDFASSLTPELRAQEEYLRAQIATRGPTDPALTPDQRIPEG